MAGPHCLGALVFASIYHCACHDCNTTPHVQEEEETEKETGIAVHERESGRFASVTDSDVRITASIAGH